jgi:hypothetical protein
MAMKQIIENFKYYLAEEEQPDFRFEALLASSSTKERGKDDILSDIRSLPGVTVVAVREADNLQPGRDYSLVSLKVDRLVLGHTSVPTIVNNLIRKISKLEGVFGFSLKGIPEQV